MNFFTYVRPKESRSISYNYVYLILACVKNFAATVTLNVLRLPVKYETDDYRLVFIVSISLLRKIPNACRNLARVRNSGLCVSQYIFGSGIYRASFARLRGIVCGARSSSTQPCIHPGSLHRVPASAGVRAGMSPLPGGR